MLGFDLVYGEIGNVPEILAFSGVTGSKALEHFIRNFGQWESIHEVDVINSRIQITGVRGIRESGF